MLKTTPGLKTGTFDYKRAQRTALTSISSKLPFRAKALIETN
jgi:hypothetical protein